jgi:hypothetical protein
MMIYTFRNHRDESNEKVTRRIFNRAGKFKYQNSKLLDF